MPAAARAALADEFITALEQGHDIPIGERGARLSQGQRQQITLARTLLRDPDVLIPDETTNALDLITDHAIRQILKQKNRPRVVIIAHRRETIDFANRVLVLGSDSLVQKGQPADLVGQAGLYVDLDGDEA